MGLFDFFRNRKTNSGYVNVDFVTKNGTSKYTFSGNTWDVDVVRACVRPFVQSVGKLSAKHIVEDRDGNIQNGQPYMKFLLAEPNALMTGQMLQEKLAWHYMMENDAYALVQRDDTGYPVGIFPLPSYGASAQYSPQGQLFLKFTLQNGKTFVFPYEDIIHLRRDYSISDVFGSDASRILERALDVIVTSDNSVLKAVRNSGAIRWLLKYRRPLGDEDIKKNVKAFTETYLNNESGSGSVSAAGVSGEADVIPVETKDFVPNALILDRQVKRIYDYFNTNEAIVQSKYTEDEWNSYYETVIEPFVKQLSMEFTRKLFSRKERSFGNKIVFDSATLQYASMSTKLNLLQMVDRGAMTPNEWRKILNLTPLEGGDKPIRRLDTAVVENGREGGTDQ